jgi:two-component system NtrC family sensor kinase
MRPSGGTGQPRPLRRKPGNLQKKITAVGRGRRPSVAEPQDELNALRRELSEAREQQAATAEVLNVISRSTFQLQPVLDTIVKTASRLCNAETALIFMFRDEKLHLVASNYASRAFVQHALEHPLTPGRGSITGRTFLERQTVHLPDCLADAEYTLRDFQAIGQHRSMLGVPLLREGCPIGVITLWRTVVLPFTGAEIDLVKTFADQAVIAIENTRLFDEVKTRTRELTKSLQQQTATADVLKIISQSTFELQPVFDAIAQTTSRLCNAEAAFIFMFREEKLHAVATNNASDAFIQHASSYPIIPERGSITGRTFLERKMVHISDCLADPEYTLRDAQAIGKYRSLLGVPLLREGVAIGVITLLRTVVMPFTDGQIDLVKTFADQAVIAIENARLFDSVEARTRELAKSLEDLRTAQDRLVQTEKLASLGQLTAGIAHEIKNPLNFVNNFSALAIDLIGELEETLQTAGLDDRVKAQITELADMLKDSLDKVVKHGKRADSIVKNMLLHSRQESGEHRPIEINGLVAESLSLAYHGARAAKQGFNITLEQSLDPAAGKVDVFPQEITRVLLNLISNGFYAATKRKADANSGDYEPTLTAMTKDLGDSVEIRIRDNGTGIPPEVRDKLFNPFFTTKPAGEGTGLGLSLSYDIIVKQHGGSIEVDTQPGEFTEFKIVLPRSAASIAQPGERR